MIVEKQVTIHTYLSDIPLAIYFTWLPRTSVDNMNYKNFVAHSHQFLEMIDEVSHLKDSSYQFFGGNF